MRRVVIFGDSIAFGQGVSLHKGWIVQLSRKLEEHFGEEILLVNSSVNGSTTHSALSRIAYEIQNPGAELVFIQFGLNDCNFWKTDNGLPRVSMESFRSNLLEIIDRCYHFNVRKIVVATNHPTRKVANSGHNLMSYLESSQKYNEIIREVANLRRTVVLIDMERNLSREDQADNFKQSYLLEDGLHLSSWGHELYGKYLISEIIRLLT